VSQKNFLPSCWAAWLVKYMFDVSTGAVSGSAPSAAMRACSSADHPQLSPSHSTLSTSPQAESASAAVVNNPVVRTTPSKNTVVLIAWRLSRRFRRPP
jgi:hypothetical protein